jgi:Cu(I)-responsive transcriptional regulator
MDPLNIGQAAAAAGVSAKMIRHYEGIGLIPKARRTYSGYRTYSDNEIHVLRFIRHARSLGFSIKEIGELVSLWQDRRRASSRVKKLATEHIRELDQKIAQMQAMKATLERLASHCHGDGRPECPILDELATNP